MGKLINEERLKGVKETLVTVVRDAAAALPFDVCVVEGVRTKTRQLELYAQGRTKPGKIVTWTLKSKHISGDAVDLAPFVNGQIDWNHASGFAAIAAAMIAAGKTHETGIRWGRDWNGNGVAGEKGETDSPHFELC